MMKRLIYTDIPEDMSFAINEQDPLISPFRALLLL